MYYNMTKEMFIIDIPILIPAYTQALSHTGLLFKAHIQNPQ